MPLVAAAVCPHPPALVTDIATGASAELDDLRDACDAAVADLLAAGPEVMLIVGGADSTQEYPYPYRASFAAWGVATQCRLGAALPAQPPLPLSLAIGVWLVGRAVAAGRVSGPVSWRAVTVAADAPVAECDRLGQRLNTSESPLAMLVMGDASACRGEKAPGYADPRAESFDASVAAALADADTEGLLAMQPRLAAELMAAGRAPWQVLAGAARRAPRQAARPWRGELRYERAPYGVTYLVAVWR